MSQAGVNSRPSQKDIKEATRPWSAAGSTSRPARLRQLTYQLEGFSPVGDRAPREQFRRRGRRLSFVFGSGSLSVGPPAWASTGDSREASASTRPSGTASRRGPRVPRRCAAYVVLALDERVQVRARHAAPVGRAAPSTITVHEPLAVRHGRGAPGGPRPRRTRPAPRSGQRPAARPRRARGRGPHCGAPSADSTSAQSPRASRGRADHHESCRGPRRRCSRQAATKPLEHGPARVRAREDVGSRFLEPPFYFCDVRRVVRSRRRPAGGPMKRPSRSRRPGRLCL